MHDDATQMVRHLAHELRQPLSTLESLAYYLDIILPSADAKAREQIGKIQQLVHQTNSIVDDAVYYVQQPASRPAVVSMSDVITKIVADPNQWRALSLDLQLDPGHCLVSIDRQQARHMIANILSFFQHIATTGSPISVTTEAQGGEMSIRFSCIAPGLAPENLERLLAPFNSSAPPGSGLSLACAQRIASIHEGEFQIVAEADERVTVWLRFPSPGLV